MLKCITKVVSTFATFTIKLFVTVAKTENSSNVKGQMKKHYITIWNNQGNDYITLNYVSYFQIDFNGFNQPYSRDKRFTIPIHQISKLIKCINKMNYNLDKYFDEIYRKDMDGKAMYLDDKHRFEVIENGFMGDQSIMMKPTIYNNYNNDQVYQAIEFSVNNTSNYFIMTMDEFLGFAYLLNKTDFYSLTECSVQNALTVKLLSKSNYLDITNTVADNIYAKNVSQRTETMNNDVENSTTQQSFKNQSLNLLSKY